MECPKCGSGEMHPDGDKLLIRGFKVSDEKGHWWSQCLVCAGYYDADLVVRPEFATRLPDGSWKHAEGGWFRTARKFSHS